MTNAADFGQGEATLSKAAEMVVAAKADFVKEASTLSGQIDEIRSKWVGQGGSSFFALHQAWTQKQRIILDALDEFSESLHSTEKLNVSTDDTQNATFANLNARLG